MIIVIGAGIAGLSLGWMLVQAGAEVTILEKGTIASGASGAAGAYLEPRPGAGKLRALEWAALDMWPEFVKVLERESDLDIGHFNTGVTHVADKYNREKLRIAARRHSDSAWQVEWLDSVALHRFEPGLSAAIVAGYHLPEVQHLDARKTCQALAIAFSRNGGILREGVKVAEITSPEKPTQLELSTGEQLEADKVVIAAGHGTNTILGLPADIPVSRPVRGIMLEMRTKSGVPLIRCPIKTSSGVILPLSGGRLLVGSSHEDGEDQLSAPDEVVSRLLTAASKTVPQIADLAIAETRMGIRSLVGDGLLRLGHSRENKNVFYSLSHAGAGFLRAPTIAKELSRVILGQGADTSLIAPFFDQPLSRS